MSDVAVRRERSLHSSKAARLGLQGCMIVRTFWIIWGMLDDELLLLLIIIRSFIMLSIHSMEISSILVGVGVAADVEG